MTKIYLIIAASVVFNLQNVYVICHQNASAGMESTSNLPPAASAPRLRPSYEVIEANITDMIAEDMYNTIESKKSSNSTNERQSVEGSPQSKTTTTTIPLPPPQNHTNNYYVPSSTSPTINYVTIGGSAAVLKTPHYYDDDGFKPFLPSPPFSENGVTVAAATVAKPSFKHNDVDGDDEYTKYATTNFEPNSPVKYEIYSPSDYGLYSTYRTIVTESNRIRDQGSGAIDYEPLSSYVKFQNDGGDRLTLPYFTTTFTPPKIEPMHRPVLVFKPSKNKQPAKHLGGGDYDSWRLREYGHGYGKQHPHQQFDYGALNELIDESNSFDDTYNIFNKPTYSSKPPKKNGLLHILATLIPIGLLLSALPPRVIFINSTNPIQHQKPFFRNLQKELSRINISDNDTAAYNLVVNIGLQPSTDPVCNKRTICQVASNGTEAENSFVESSLWHLLSRSSDIIREKLNLQDVYEAVKSKQCSKFACNEESKRDEPEPSKEPSSVAFSTKLFHRKPH